MRKRLPRMRAAGFMTVAVLLAAAISTFLTSSEAFASTYDGPAELPRVFIHSQLANTPAPGQVLLVPAGGSFQAALNGAQCGDTIELQAGAAYVGNFTVPAKPCDNQHWIIVRTSALNASLPAEGVRVTPCYGGVASLPGRPAFPCPSPHRVLATLVNPFGGSGSGPLRLAPGANHYRFLGLEITRAIGTGGVASLVYVAQGGPVDNIVIDRSWLHGDTHEDTKNGVALRDTTYFSIVDSYFSDFHCTSLLGACTDANAIGGGNGNNPGGPYQIVDNFLEASGQSILFGGGGATTTPADIEIRHNHMFKPLLWKPGTPGFIGGISGYPYIVKNHFELKNAQRVLFEGNILENSWGGFSQTGSSILLMPLNQYSIKTNTNVCPACQVTDITIRYSTISHVGGGFQIATAVARGAAALAGARFSIHDITMDDISASKYTGGGGAFLLLNTWPSNVLHQVTINHVTAFPDPRVHILTIGDNPNNPKMSEIVITNNIFGTAQFPVWSALGSPDCAGKNVPVLTFNACFSGYAVSYNALIAMPSAYGSGSWPGGNYYPSSPAVVQFVNFNNGIGGNYQLLPSSPYQKAGSDGLDLGANIAAIAAATAGVY
ncbi:MAG TPA: hypothetical protein VF011_17930 [Terriglobales bacterium]